jgi:hypothetical protein
VYFKRVPRTRLNYKKEVENYEVLVPTDFVDEIDFPFVLTKPIILEATERAINEKIFDDLGVLPARQRNGDPMVIGRIRDPRGVPDARYLSFMVCWFVDTTQL